MTSVGKSECGSHCADETFDFLKATRGLHSKDLGMQARSRERYWGSLQNAWLARNAFEEWRSIALVATSLWVTAKEPLRGHVSEVCEFEVLNQLQKDLATKDVLIAHLRRDVENAVAKRHREQREAITSIAAVALEIRGATHERILLKQWVFSCLRRSALEARHHICVNLLEVKMREAEVDRGSMHQAISYTQQFQPRHAHICQKCVNAWRTYCLNYKRAVDMQSNHLEQVSHFEGMVFDTDSQSIAAQRRTASDTVSRCMDLRWSVERVSMSRCYFDAWHHHFRRSCFCLRRSSKVADCIKSIRCRIPLLDICSAWSQLVERARLSKRQMSWRKAMLISMERRTRLWHRMQDQHVVLRAFVQWSKSRNCCFGLKRLVSSRRHVWLLRSLSLVFHKWLDTCTSLKHARDLSKVAAEVARFALRPSPLPITGNIFSQWRCEVEHNCRTREIQMYQQRFADTLKDRTNCLKQQIAFTMSKRCKLFMKAIVVRAWMLLCSESIWCLWTQQRGAQWITRYRSLRDTAFICESVRTVFQSWHRHATLRWVSINSPSSSHIQLRAFMRWILGIKYETWKRRQQEVAMLLSQARTHLSEAETDRWHCRENMYTLARSTVHSYLLLHVGLSTLRAICAWRTVIALSHRQEPRLSRPFARLETHLIVYMTYSSWHSYSIGMRNVAVVEKLVRETQDSRISFGNRTRRLSDNIVVLRDTLITYFVMDSWKQALINLRMCRSLDYVRNMACNIRNHVARRIQENHQKLLSNCLDSWRWLTDSIIQRHRGCLHHTQPVLNHAREQQLCDRKHHEHNDRQASLLSLQQVQLDLNI